MYRGAVLLSLAFSLAACGGDDGNNTGGTGAGTAAGVMAGTLAGTGGVGVTGGTAAGMGVTGGTAAGTGVTGGTAAGTGMTGGTGAGMTSGTGAPTFVPGSPTFSAVFNEIILAKCGGPFCHSGTISTLKMSDQAETYAALINAPAMSMNTTAAMVNCSTTGLMRVVPSDPDNSLLVKKIEAAGDDQPCGQPMPPPPNMLTADQIAQVRMWVANGALDD